MDSDPRFLKSRRVPSRVGGRWSVVGKCGSGKMNNHLIATLVATHQWLKLYFLSIRCSGSGTVLLVDLFFCLENPKINHNNNCKL